MLYWILPGQCMELGFQEICDGDTVMRFYSVLRSILIKFFYVIFLFLVICYTVLIFK